MFILFVFIALSAAADVDFNKAKYLIHKDGSKIHVIELGGCSESEDGSNYEKYITVNQQNYKKLRFTDAECKTKDEEGEDLTETIGDYKYADKLPEHIGYQIKSDKKECAKYTQTQYELFIAECIQTPNVADRYEKNVIASDNMMTKYFSESTCKTAVTTGETEKNQGKCGECKEGYMTKCEKKAEAASPSGGNTNTVDFNTAKYVIYSNEPGQKTIYELRKCSKTTDNKFLKHVGASATEFKMCTYKDDKCTTEDVCDKISMENMKYANDLPTHVGYKTKAVDTQCTTITENMFTLFVAECAKTSVDNQDKYVNAVVEGGKMLIKTYSDNQCKTLETQYPATEKGECGKCLSRNSGADNSVMKCQTYSPPSGGNKNGSIQTFVLFALTILMFFF